MSSIIFFLIPLFVLGLIIPASAEKGYNYDNELIGQTPEGAKIFKWSTHHPRIYDAGEYHDYIYYDAAQIKTVETEGGTVSLDSFCNFSFYKKGFLQGTPLFSDSITAFNMIQNSFNWQEVTQINEAACSTSFDEQKVSLSATRHVPGIGTMIYKYMFVNGVWKTQLEVTNLTALQNRVFGFDQTINLYRDTVKFGGNTVNLDNFHNQTFDRQWLENNEAKIIRLLNGYNFDFDIGFEYLDSITIIDNGLNTSQLIFHYMRNNEVLMPNETLIIDPSISISETNRYTAYTSAAAGAACPTAVGGSIDNMGWLQMFNNAAAGACGRTASEFPIGSLPLGAVVTDTVLNFTISGVTSSRNCSFYGMTDQPSTLVAAEDLWAAIGSGTLYLSNDATCTSAGSKTVDLGTSADTDLTAAVDAGQSWFGVGYKIHDETRDGFNHWQQFTTSQLDVTYEVYPPDAVDDLSSPSQSFGSVDLLWTQPGLNGNPLLGYQINYTTPYGNPTTIIENNTGTSATTSTITGLDIATPYTFGVSAWTYGGTNATNPPMLWLNVTTSGNFTIGNVLLNQTNTQVLPITFEEQDINSTAKFLNVTFANTYDLNCDFHYKFANTNTTYSNLTSYAVSSTLNETSFVITNFDNEIIDVNCFDTISGTDADYLLRQISFELLDQIDNFRNGTYGTDGKIGVFDGITLLVVIISMIGLNRVNESVGAVFNIMFLGSLAFFEIIELPTVIFGLLAVVLVFIVTSTRKV